MVQACNTWMCGAAMALNITATFLSAFTGGSEDVCRPYDGACSSQDHHLLFGNMTGLRMQPLEPKGRLVSARQILVKFGPDICVLVVAAE
jgi:hypothetical protein